MNMARRTKTISRRKGTFDPHDTSHVTHSRLGVWDLYEQKHTPIIKVPGSSRFERLAEFKQSLPYVWRMLKDIGSIKGLWLLLVSYLVAEVVSALMPALSLWYGSSSFLHLHPSLIHASHRYKGQLLTIVSHRQDSSSGISAPA